MQTRTLRAHMKARGWSQSDLARAVGVSRQAVSLWLGRGGATNVRSGHLVRASEALGVSLDALAHPLPCLDEEEDALRALLLWDGLYEDLVDFALALIRREPKAVGRLVEVYGLYAAAKIVGPSTWTRFPEYARYVHPTRRRQLETLVAWHRSRAAS